MPPRTKESRTPPDDPTQPERSLRTSVLITLFPGSRIATLEILREQNQHQVIVQIRDIRKRLEHAQQVWQETMAWCIQERDLASENGGPETPLLDHIWYANQKIYKMYQVFLDDSLKWLSYCQKNLRNPDAFERLKLAIKDGLALIIKLQNQMTANILEEKRLLDQLQELGRSHQTEIQAYQLAKQQAVDAKKTWQLAIDALHQLEQPIQAALNRQKEQEHRVKKIELQIADLEEQRQRRLDDQIKLLDRINQEIEAVGTQAWYATVQEIQNNHTDPALLVQAVEKACIQAVTAEQARREPEIEQIYQTMVKDDAEATQQIEQLYLLYDQQRELLVNLILVVQNLKSQSLPQIDMARDRVTLTHTVLTRCETVLQQAGQTYQDVIDPYQKSQHDYNSLRRQLKRLIDQPFVHIPNPPDWPEIYRPPINQTLSFVGGDNWLQQLDPLARRQLATQTYGI